MKSSKFFPPIFHIKAIKRVNLVKKIDDRTKSGLLFIYAPTGYGKTIGVTLWQRFKKINVAWLNLDIDDNNITTFRQNLYMSISSAIPSNQQFDFSSHQGLEFVFNATSYYKTLHEIFSNSSIPKAIAIDNFDSQCHSFIISEMLVAKRYMPFDTSVIIISRNPPPPQLYSYLANHEVCLMDLEDFQFTKQEMQELLDIHNIKSSSLELEYLFEATEGWPALVLIIIFFYKDSYIHNVFGMMISHHVKMYFISHVVDTWNKSQREILLKTVLISQIDLAFCEALIETKDSFEVIKKISQRTGLITQDENSNYIYHPIFRNFLLSQLSNEEQKEKWYSEVAVWLSVNCNPIEAFDMAIKSQDPDIMDQVLTVICDSQNFSVDIDKLDHLITYELQKYVDLEVIRKKPMLTLKFTWLYFINGRFDKLNIWLSYIDEMLSNNELKDFTEIGTAIMMKLLICKSPWDILRLMEKSAINSNINLSNKANTAVSFTHSLPFFHKAQHDYAEVSLCSKEYLDMVRPFLAPLLGTAYPILEKLLAGGLLYERNMVDDAYMEIKPLLSEKQLLYAPELSFSFSSLMCEILFLRRERKLALQELKKCEETIIKKGSSLLLQNLKAYKTKLELYQGDVVAALLWLEICPPFINDNLKFYHVFQNLVTLRALIVKGRIGDALEFSDKLLAYSKMYGRIIDTVEILLLKSACLWHVSKKNYAVENMERALIIASKYEIIVPFLSESADIIPILEYSNNRMRMGLCEPSLDRGFLLHIFLIVKEAGKSQKGLFQHINKKPKKFSQKQLNIIKLLEQNLTYEQIANETSTKISTVRDHISKIYEKLEVNNSKEAIIKAKDLKLL